MSKPPTIVVPVLLAAAAKAGESLEREGMLNNAGDQVYAASENGVLLELKAIRDRDVWLVAEARHRGAQSQALSGVLDAFCLAIENLPIREAADHGAIHALARLRDDPLPPGVSGILTPRSAGSAFRLCERLIRVIAARHEQERGARDAGNFWTPPLSARWRSQSNEERIDGLRGVMAKFHEAFELAPSDLWIERIEKNRRVIVTFGPTVDYHDKPSLLLRLEVAMRQSTGERLEVFMAEAKDTNSIRRLGPEGSPR